MMSYIILSAIFLLCGTIVHADGSCKASSCVGVDVYYESLCGDSMLFITNQLVPSYSDLKDHLDINFIPYGKATHKRDDANKWEFTCQHGSAECKGNKAQACGLDAIKSTEAAESKQSLSVELVGCVMGSTYPSTAVPRCADTVGLSEPAKQKMSQCIQSTSGDDLLALHGDKTHSLQPGLSFVPTIVINGAYSADNQKAALSNFKKLICSLLPAGDKPASCA